MARFAKVNYTRLKALPKFENERIGVEIELGPNENVDDALDMARLFVNDQLGLLPSEDEVRMAKAILKQAGLF